MPIRFISVATGAGQPCALVAQESPCSAQSLGSYPTACKPGRMLRNRPEIFQIQLVDPVHDRQIGGRDRTWQVIDATSAQA